MSTRTIADIEADIVNLKKANPNWLTDSGVQALITSLTNQINVLSSASMQPAGVSIEKKRVQISFLPSEYAGLPAEVRIFTMNEKSWKDEFKGHNIERLLTPAGDSVATFERMEDGGCYRAVRTIDHYLRSFKSAKVDADVLEIEAALALSAQIKIEYPDCHLHQNMRIRNYLDKGQVAQQLDGVLHGHLSAPTFAMVMEAKTSIHPDHLAEILERVTLFRGYVSEAHKYSFSAGWEPNPPSLSLTHFSNVTHFIPCLAGRRFPDNLVQDCLIKGIVPVFPSGARYVAKGLEFLRKIV